MEELTYCGIAEPVLYVPLQRRASLQLEDGMTVGDLDLRNQLAGLSDDAVLGTPELAAHPIFKVKLTAGGLTQGATNGPERA